MLCFLRTALTVAQPSTWNERWSWLSQSQARKGVHRHCREGRDPPKARSDLWPRHAESYLIRGERQLARMDFTLAPPPVNDTGPHRHLSVREFQWSRNVEAAGKASLQILPLVEYHVYGLSNGTEWTDCQGKCTNLHQAREKSPWDRNDMSAMTSDEIITFLGLKTLLACCLVLSANEDKT